MHISIKFYTIKIDINRKELIKELRFRIEQLLFINRMVLVSKLLIYESI